MTWIVPGAPLEKGRGWRLWYSQGGAADFQPAAPRVRRAGTLQVIQTQWSLLPQLAGLARRMGVLEVVLDDPHPGASYEVEFPEAARPLPFRWRSLPSEIPTEGVTFLVASCFWRDSAKGAYEAGILELTRRWNPVFKLLVGDQVYADWPSERSLQLGGKAAVELYAQRYEEYWGDASYQVVLQAQPNLFSPDDHEFWNDYPEVQVHLARSLPWNRERYEKAARALYRRYQACANPGGNLWYSFSLGSVSFFVADTRSQRDRSSEGAHVLGSDQWQDLETWARGLRGPGVLVLGQPLYQEEGDFRDHSLANFTADYGRLLRCIEASLRGENGEHRPHDLLILSGDIHTGRFAVGYPAGLDGVGVPELIASPASMIHPGSKTPSRPPERISVPYGREPPRWDVRLLSNAEVPTLSDNLALVRLRPGTNGRIAFDLWIHELRPRDGRSWWDRAAGEAPPTARVRALFRKTIELR